MVREALSVALTAPCDDSKPFGETAGDTVMQLAADRGLDTDLHDLYAPVVHHAALADVLVSAIRKPIDKPWLIPPSVQNWTSACFLSPDGAHLRRIVLVSHWTPEREQSEKRSWFTAGEIAAYDLPMQMIVLVIGQQGNGKRISPWVKGFLHPQNKQLRFRKKERSTSEVFNDRWVQIYREDHAEITREKWLESMLKDDVLRDCCFRIDIPTVPPEHRTRILDMAETKLQKIAAMKETPEMNLSSCDWPVACVFKKCCWSNPEREPSEKTGYLRQTDRRET